MSPRSLAIALSLALLAIPSQARQELPAGAAPATLLGDCFPDGAFEPATVARRASALEAAPELLFAAFGTGRIERTAGEPLAVTGEVERALALAVEDLGRHAFYPLWESALAADAPAPADLRATLRLIELVGVARDVPSLLLAVAVLDPSHRLGAEPTRHLETAVAALVARDSATLGALSAGFSSRPRPARVALVRAVGLSGVPERSAWLVERIGVDRSVNLAVLGELSRPGQSLLAARSVERLHEMAVDEDRDVRREAARALGHLGDFESLAVLILLLEDDEPTVRANAHTALRAITGLGFSTDPVRWRGWLARERDWFEREAPELFRRLRDRNPDVVGTTLEALGRHRYRRDDLAREILPLLADPEPRVRLSACAALERLGSRLALEDLALALEDEDPRVGEAAWAALRRMTGLALVPVAEEWLGALAQAG